MMDFKTYIEKFKDEANKIDVPKEIPMVYSVYEEAKLQLESAELESEKIEARSKIEKLLIGNKKRIFNSIISKTYQTKYKGFVPFFLIEIKMHLMYSDLLNKSQNRIEEEEVKKFQAKVYALSYFLDCEATGEREYNTNKQNETETILSTYSEGKPSGSTIRKKLSELRVNTKQIFTPSFIYDTIEKENWREVLLKLSKHPKKLDEWLKSKQL